MGRMLKWGTLAVTVFVVAPLAIAFAVGAFRGEVAQQRLNNVVAQEIPKITQAMTDAANQQCQPYGLHGHYWVDSGGKGQVGCVDDRGTPVDLEQVTSDPRILGSTPYWQNGGWVWVSKARTPATTPPTTTSPTTAPKVV